MDPILDLPEQNKVNLKYTGFGLRAGAAVIDTIIGLAFFLILYFLILMALGVNLLTVFTGEGPGTTGIVSNEYYVFFLFGLIIGSFLGVALYFTLMESSSFQATLGKRLLGIYIGKEDGSRITFANSLGRYFARLIWYAIMMIISKLGIHPVAALIIGGIVLILSFLMPLWEEKKQALHDKICKTYVFYK